MAIEVGTVLDGTVTGITKFGAFIDLGEKQTGLVHISEVANEYVENIADFLKVQDRVKVKVLTVEGNKIGLSIKQTQEKKEKENKGTGERRDFNDFKSRSPRNDNSENRTHFAKRMNSRDNKSFEEKMKMFLKDSDERLLDLKRNTEGKRGGRGGRRD